MNLANVKNRWQAFGIHLALSVVIFIFLLGVIVFIWYPGVFIHMGGFQGIRIVAGVDLVLGPLLTLMIFNPNKRKALIKLDLSIIAFIQLSALLVGTWLVYKERPLVQALSDDGLYIHALSEYETTETDYSSLKKLPGRFPKLVYVNLPNERKSSNLIKMKSYFEDSKSITLDTSRYIPFRDIDRNKIKQRLDQNNLEQENHCFWIETISIHREGKVCFSPSTGVVQVD